MNSIQKRNSGTGFRDSKILFPPGIESGQGFSPKLTWSHYRALMRIQDEKARNFYEREAIDGGLDKCTLERQIHLAVPRDRCKARGMESGIVQELMKLQGMVG
jgi:hypothetical protein